MKKLVSKTILVALIAASFLLTTHATAAGPTVTIVTGPKMHPLEQLAVEEVSTQLKELFGAKVSVADSFKIGGNVVLIGNPDSNPKIAGLSGVKWPKLSAQGHLIKSVKSASGTVLVVGGGSPVATYWAAVELGHHFGVRRLLHGDFPPLKKPAFSLAGINVRLEPNIKTRAWRTLGDSPASQVSWSLEEHRVRLRQLAKLKFNHIILPLKSSQPFFAGNKSGKLWPDPELRVDGETAGRAAFGEDRVFNNPDFKSGTGSEAGIRLVRGIITEARRLGMKTTITGAGSKANVAAYRKTYPKADLISRSSDLTLIQIGNLDGNVLPQFDLNQVRAAISGLRRSKGNGFAVACQLPDDLNTSVYYLSRAGFDAEMTPVKAVQGLVNPICGDGVGARIAIGFDHLAKASALVDRHDPTIATPCADVIMRHYANSEPVPEWWAEAKSGFIMAMNEMYRANTRARGGARAFSLYLAKRFEFALHYFTCLESIRAAGIARAAKDKDGQLENLDKAVEAMHNALGAMADVDRNNGDRGVIAVLNEYAFRPLSKELERVDQQ